jgi:DNA primase
MKFFERYYEGISFDDKERVKVICPFHDDTVASAVVNVQDNSFHCFACGVHYNEQQFLAKVNSVELSEASVVLSRLEEQFNNWKLVEKAELWANATLLAKVRNLGLSDDTIDMLDLGLSKTSNGHTMLGIPIFYNGVLMNTIRYNIAKIPNTPKVVGDSGAESGLVFPYDLWVKNKETTYIFEGEKDACMGIELGLNAITLTGGANAKPNELVKSSFKDRKVVICYDNDEAGRTGARALYKELKNIAKSVTYLNIGEIVREDKEDLHDAVMKYGMDLFTFLTLKEYEFDEEELEEDTLISIQKALKENKIKQELKSHVIVNADFSDTYAVPTSVTFVKVAETKADTMVVGEERTWYFTKKNMKQVLSLIEIGAKEKEVISNIKSYKNIPSSEKGIKVIISGYQTIYKVRVVDSNSKVVADVDEEHSNLTIDMYSLESLNVGEQYILEYSIYPHPSKNQKLVAIASSIKPVTDDKYKINKTALMPFYNKVKLEDKLSMLHESAKHHVAKHLNYNLWLMSDLVFNSVLQIDYGDRIRGALDVFILGDTQVGKSETTSKLTQLYNFGHFLSLKTSTTVGLIGGSHKVDNSMLNTIGAIPRQHKRLVVLEEFSGAEPSFIKTMTDIRTSGRLRITRVAGELNVPCMLRMITISNPVNDEKGNPRFLSTFPNGVSPIMELIKSAEDVARYDAFLLVSKVEERFNPFKHKLANFVIPKESYEHKSQWVYSRRAENVIMSDHIKSYIWDKSQELNEHFESNFPLFGTTTPLKLARFATALATLVFNVDSTFENIIVEEEHVDYIVNYFKKIYDNKVFKLHEYKQEYDSFSTATNEDIEVLQKLYSKNSVMLEELLKVSQITTINLRIVSGHDNDKFNPIFSKLVKHKFLTLSGQSVFPTPKFREAMSKINKEFTTDTGELKVSVENTDLTFKIE